MFCIPRKKCIHLFMTIVAFSAIISTHHILNMGSGTVVTGLRGALTTNRTEDSGHIAINLDKANFGIIEEKKTIVTKPVRLLCWILTDPFDLDKRVIHVKNTWAKRCDFMLYMSSAENNTFPTIGLNVTAGRNHIASKSKAAWTHIYNNYLDKADFFVKADPDTYIVVENMKLFLQEKNTSEPEFYGHMMILPHSNITYASGGPGIILTRESVRRLVTQAFKNPKDCMPDGQLEDFKTGKCLKTVGGRAVNTKDSQGREMCFIFGISTHIKGSFPEWYLQYVQNKTSGAGLDNCCSDHPISFHYVASTNLYMLEYLFYRSHLPIKH